MKGKSDKHDKNSEARASKLVDHISNTEITQEDAEPSTRASLLGKRLEINLSRTTFLESPLRGSEASTLRTSLSPLRRAPKPGNENMCIAVFDFSQEKPAAMPKFSLAKIEECSSEDEYDDAARKDAARDATHSMKDGNFICAVRRFPALMLTLACEMVVAFVISNYQDSFKANPLLMSFLPVISAISGNIGLQASSINVRALAVGLLSPKEFSKATWRTVAQSFFLSVGSGAVIGVIAGIWNATVLFGAVICLGMFISGLTAGFFGGLAPLCFKRLGIDPTSIAGPMETAFQDMVGSTLFVIMAYYLL
jgi:cation transporter-like permease